MMMVAMTRKGWMNGIDEWTGEWMNEWTRGRVDKWMDEWKISKWISGWKNGWMTGWMMYLGWRVARYGFCTFSTQVANVSRLTGVPLKTSRWILQS